MFITFEGIEGSGKSTALKSFATHLIGEGHVVLCTREPGGSSLGRDLRKMLLDETSSICPVAELFLFLADRAQHVQEVIRPALGKGHIVLCDRYIDSTLAYQGGGRGLDMTELLSLHKISTDDLWPNLTFLFDVPVSIGINRAVMRNSKLSADKNERRFDAESLKFHEQVRTNYILRAAQNKNRFAVIDATSPPQAVLEDCIKAFKKFMEVK